MQNVLDATITEGECAKPAESVCDDSKCPEGADPVCGCLPDSTNCQTFSSKCVMDAKNCVIKPGCMFLKYSFPRCLKKKLICEKYPLFRCNCP